MMKTHILLIILFGLAVLHCGVDTPYIQGNSDQAGDANQTVCNCSAFLTAACVKFCSDQMAADSDVEKDEGEEDKEPVDENPDDDGPADDETPATDAPEDTDNPDPATDNPAPTTPITSKNKSKPAIHPLR